MKGALRIVYASAFMLLAFAVPVLAQDDAASAEAIAVLDRVAAEIEAAAPEDRAAVYEALRSELAAVAADVPALDLYLRVADAQFAGTEAAALLDEAARGLAGASAPLTDEQAQAAAGGFVAAAAENASAGPELPAQLYAFAKEVERLSNAGLGVAGLSGEEAPTMELLELAAKWVKAGLSAAELAEKEGENFSEFYSDTMDVIPTHLNPALSGPAGIAFRDQLEWNRKMWGASTDGVDLIADAIETGELDHERLAEITGRIEQLGREGPWGGATGRDFLKKFVEEVPVLGKLFKAVWPSDSPEEEDDVCGPIDCDCDNLEFGILTGPYRDECRGAEQALIAHCQAVRRIEGSCHPTASGPNPNPP